MAGASKGAAGERLAARYLQQQGYTIVTSNYRGRFGEIDIIASDGTYIAFVEVKTRREGALYAPREAVTAAKQRRIAATAAQFLGCYPTALQPRFDVIEVVTDPADPLRAERLEHIRGAFEAGDLHEAF